MREFNALIYSVLKADSEIGSCTGASAQDPRTYKGRSPVKLKIETAKPAYLVYYIMGSSRTYGGVDIIEKNNYTYGIEIWGKKDTDVETIAYRVEKLFQEKRFVTTSFIIGYTFATRGSLSFDEVRQLWTETITVNLTHILALSEAS